MGACQKQSPSDLSPDYVDSTSDLRRGEACRNVDMLNNIVELSNIKNLFVCSTWDQKFPALYSALVQVDGKDWNRFAAPLNEHIFNDRNLRDSLISLMNELDRKGGLDELAKVITTLSDSNFYFHVNKLLKCSLDGESCLLNERLEKEDLWEFFSFFKLSSENIKSLSGLLRTFSFTFKGEGNSFVTALRTNLSNQDFITARNNFFNEILIQMGEDNFRNELKFYRKVLLEDTREGWLPHMVRNSFDRDEFITLIRHPVDGHRDLWKDFKILEKTLALNIACNGNEGNPGFSVDISTHLNEFVNLLFSNDQSEFFRTSLQSVAIMKLAKEVCPQLLGYEDDIRLYGDGRMISHKVDFITMMEKTTSLLLEPDYFTFVQKMQESRPFTNKDNLYLIKYFSSDLFASFVDLVKTTTSRKDDLASSLYDVFRSMPVEGYEYLSETFDILEGQEDATFKALSKTWKNLGEEGRYFFFNFLDQHYTKDANLTLLFDFYTAVFDLMSEKAPLVFQDFFRDDLKDESLESLKIVTGVLSGENLLEDFKKFFSREHIIEIIKIVSRGSVRDEGVADILGNYVFEPQSQGEVLVSRDLLTPSVTKKCLNSLVQVNLDFYDMLNGLPASCVPLAKEDPLFKFFNEANEMVASIGTPFGRYGFFSPGMISSTTQLLNSISKKFADGTEEGLSVKLGELSSWLSKDQRKDDFVKFMQIFDHLDKDQSDIVGVFSRFYGDKENFTYLKHLTKGLPLIINSYEKYNKGSYSELLTKSEYDRDDSFICDNYHQKVGGIPCPDQTQLKGLIKRVIDRTVKKNDENPKALEQMLRMVATNYGLPIPYESETPRFKRVTLKESFEMFYAFTDRTKATNQFKFEYRPIPKADEQYFQTPEWEVDRKQVKGAPEPYDVVANTMERIEVVIRDVRFDENYLGAHYLNAVAKTEDYDKTVEGKYSLLKTCIPLKFCGKFMDKAQHRFAKNSKETFLALLDVNTKEEWKFGDYMQALLTSLVSSSPDKSQVSSIVNKRFLGLNIQIPWLNRKKDLVDHNGKILGLVSMAGMFTNSARILRDRVGRSVEEFQKFLNSEKLRKADEGLFRNFRPDDHLGELESLLLYLRDSKFMDSFLDYAFESDYDQQRLWEQVIFKGMYLSAYLADAELLERYEDPLLKARYQNLSVLDYLELVKVVLESHENISDILNLKDKETLLKINHLLDVVAKEIEDKNSRVEMLLHESAFFLKENKRDFLKITKEILAKDNLAKVKESIDAGLRFIEEVSRDKGSIIAVLEHIEQDDTISWDEVRVFLRYNGAKQICNPESEGYSCRNNSTYRELQRILNYLIRNNGKNLNGLLDYVLGSGRLKINELLKKIFPSINNETL